MPGNFEPGNSASKHTTYDSGFDSHPAVGGLAGQRKRRVSEEIGYLFLFGSIWEFIERFPRRARRDSCRRQASTLWIGNERLVGFRESGQDRQVFRANQTIDRKIVSSPADRSSRSRLASVPDSNETVWILRTLSSSTPSTRGAGWQRGSGRLREYLVAEPVKGKHLSPFPKEKINRPYTLIGSGTKEKAKLNLLASGNQNQVAESPTWIRIRPAVFSCRKPNSSHRFNLLCRFRQKRHIDSDSAKDVRKDKVSLTTMP